MMPEEVYQSSLFNDCPTKCAAYGACGGNRSTAPCSCFYSIQSGKRYKCKECYIICRDVGKFDLDNKRLKDFDEEIADGYTLDQVAIKQLPTDLPIFIPSLTEKSSSEKLFTEYVAVDLRMMFNFSEKRKAKLKHHFKTSQLLRKRLNVSKDCGLIAVLNGHDSMLEYLWASDRVSILKQLYEIGFTICTGPTFSVTALTTTGAPVPFSHHTAMFMRHHKMMSEIANTGLSNVPNLYWIDDDSRMMRMWADWLNANPDIYLISKDFTSTHHWSTIEQKLSELIDIISISKRRFHILIVGTGAANAKKVVNKITLAGHGVSIITSAPILKALHGSQYVVDDLGNLTNVKCSKTEWPFSSLIPYNIKLFEDDLKNFYFQ